MFLSEKSDFSKNRKGQPFMLSKLVQIFLVLALGALFAVLFAAPVRRISCFYGKYFPVLQSHPKWKTRIAVLSWYFFLLSFLVCLLGLFYANICQYFSFISFPEFLEKINRTIQNLFRQVPFLQKIGLEKYMLSVIDNLVKLPGILTKIAVAFMISFYLLLDLDHYLQEFRRIRKNLIRNERGRMVVLIFCETKRVLYGYLKGQSLDSLLMGVLIGFGLWIFHVPFGVSIGILAGIGNMIPYVGPLIAYSMTCFFCILEGKKKTLFLAVYYLLIIQQMDGSFIGPKLLSRQMQIRPLLVIISILIGGTLFGPIGMLFSVPAAAVCKTTIQILQKRGCA